MNLKYANLCENELNFVSDNADPSCNISHKIDFLLVQTAILTIHFYSLAHPERHYYVFKSEFLNKDSWWLGGII